MTQISASGTLQERKALAYAKKGIVLALLSGMIFSLDGILIEQGKGYSAFTRPELWLLLPFFCSGAHDLSSAIITTFINWRQGRFTEIWRSLLSRPGRAVIGGAFLGSILGMGGYMTALQLVGPAYVLPITSLYPAVAALLAGAVLKEKISARAWLGLGLCVCGAIIIGYTPPGEQGGSLFYLGMAAAAVAAIGWGAEGVCATSGMDFIEPGVALNIYYVVSSTLHLLIFMPLAAFVLLPRITGASGPEALGSLFSSPGLGFIVLAGCMGALSYRAWYAAMNMTGVSRAMALNISYALWGILLSAFFTELVITSNLIIGALIIFAGMFIVIGNPRDMLNLRKVE